MILTTLTDLEICGNVAAIPEKGGQGNVLIGDYIPSMLYATICLTPYQKLTNPGNNPSYPTDATQVTRYITKDTWERD